MYILRVIASMNPVQGGPCQGIRNSIPALEKLGVKNEVVCLDDPHSAFLKHDTLTIHAIGPGKSAWCYSTKLIPWLLDNLTRFDAVIVHGLWQYHGYAVKKALTLLKSKEQVKNVPKFFVMPHGMLDPYFQRAKGRKLKAIRNWLYWQLIESNIVNKADGVLFTCRVELELAREPFKPYQPKQTIHVGYGIVQPPAWRQEMYDAFKEKYPELHSRPYILFLSRIHEKKGVDMLIKAYHRLLKSRTKCVLVDASGAKEDFLSAERLPHLVIAGPGLDTAYGAYLQQMVAASSELEKSVNFTGMLSGDAKWGAFYGCEAFVLPSHQENFGISVVEALACAKPVLISNQVNIWHEIEGEQGGIVGDDTQEDTLKILTAWMNLMPEHRKAMGKCARYTFVHHFAIEPHVKRLLEAVS